MSEPGNSSSYLNPAEFKWSSRVTWLGEKKSVAYSRNHSFVIDQQASFKETDPNPSALEYLLGALGGDIIAGFQTEAARRNIFVDGIEVRVTGKLNNSLVYLGVIGESGNAGLDAIDIKIYITGDAVEQGWQEIWQAVQLRSPLLNTLGRCLALNVELKVAF